MEHTKGPWKKNGEQVILSDGSSIEQSYFKREKEEAEANAQLIAAAPELLQSVRNLVGLVRSLQLLGMDKHLGEEEINQIHDAEKSIQKAINPEPA